MAPPYSGTPDFPHGRPDLTGVLLVNLGTPDAPTTPAVRRYLAEFLWDPRVVEQPRLLWWLLLNGVILRLRPRRSAQAYTRIWTAEGSPLMVLTRRLCAAVASKLDPTGVRPLAVRVAMRYGEPSIPSVLRELQGLGLRRLLVLPLYPQYSATTTASVFDAVAAELARWRFVPELRFVQDYWADPAWLDAVAQSIRPRRGGADDPHLLFSFHGIPRRYFAAGDPYFCQCQGSAREIAARLGLAPAQWSIAFQSRVGNEPWLQPYTDETLAAMPARGIRRVQVVCPGFAVDCLETLEEIAMENRERFLHAGGESYEYLPALNDAPAHVAQLAALVRRHGHGWDALDADPAALAAAASARAARQAALRSEDR